MQDMKFKIKLTYECVQEFEGTIKDLEREINRTASIESQRIVKLEVNAID